MSHDDSSADAAGFRLAPQQEYLLAAGPGAAVQCAVALPGPMGAPELRDALQRAVARHEILRTTFGRVAGLRARQQVIHETAPVSVEAQVATLLDEATLDVALAREAQDAFDLEHGPLLRARVLTATDASVLILTAAASCLDAPSLLGLADELAGALGGDDPDDEPLQFADYAEWRSEHVTGEEAEAGRAFWSARAASEDGGVGDKSPIATVSSHTPSPVPAFTLQGDAHERLSAIAARAGVPPSVVLEAIWHIVVARLHGRAEVTVATWLDGRTQPDLQGAIGPYSQPVPVTLRLEPETSLAEVVDRVARGRARAQAAQDHATATDLAALLDGADAAVHTVTAASTGALRALRATPTTRPVTLELELAPGSARGQLSGGAQAPEQLRALADHLRHAVDGALADPGQPAHALPLLSEAQRAQLLAAGAGPEPGPDAAVPFPAQFAAQVGRTPDAIAVSSATEQLTYAQLDERAGAVARRLHEAGAGPGAVVGLCMSRTPEMVAALLGILKAGGAYLPLAPDHPAARRARLLTDAGALALVTEPALREELETFDGAIVCPAEEDTAVGAGAPGADVAAEDLAYVMFTSGSTGEPKGVQVTHANLANYTAAMVERLHAREQPLRFGVVSAISTDLGNTAIFPALASGGSLHLVDLDAAMDADAFAAAVRGHELDVLKIAPSHLRAILGDPAALPRRWLVLGGEALSWELVERIRTLSPGCRMVNHYGPTETTVGCATYDVDQRPRQDSATVPIGHPLAGTRAYVLDALGAPVPDGSPGELCIGGAGVAAGYVGPDTQERFIADVGGDGRMYRTGDRVRRLHDGALQFLGRLDDQVKVRGYRVEPGEVEAALSTHPAVRQAAVAVAGEGDDARLVAYLVAGDVSVEELQGALGATLPDYMIPSTFLIVDALPLTPSGKVDRRALPELAAAQARRDAAYVGPRDEIEQAIAAIWCELLGVERVGVFDDFFALGGHSLLATQAIMRIRREHGDIPLRALLASPTVAAVAEVVRSARSGTAHAHSAGR